MANRERRNLRNLVLQNRNQRLAALCALVAFAIVVGATIAARFNIPRRPAVTRSPVPPTSVGVNQSPATFQPVSEGVKPLATLANQQWLAVSRNGRLAQRSRNTTKTTSQSGGTPTLTNSSGNFATESGNAPVLSRRSSLPAQRSLNQNEPIPGRW
ncbi:MAG: hypothetical protein SFW36_18700 [Leptolyngbyaceae cyanobacterium bins.59]|nr:hypothetical protein [Leptolyngbyaceae cyanobacterium bins.59]